MMDSFPSLLLQMRCSYKRSFVVEAVLLLGVTALIHPRSSHAFSRAAFSSQRKQGLLERQEPRTSSPWQHHDAQHSKKGRIRNLNPLPFSSKRQYHQQRTTSTKLQLTSSALAHLHGNPSYVLSWVLWLSTFGIALEKRTTIGKALSAPLATMALGLVVANVGLLPFSSSVYSMVNSFLIPLAVPLLLFDSDLKRVLRDTGTLLAAFGVGAAATVLGTMVAFPLLPLRGLGPGVGWKVACALAARHIGGAINFVAVAETLNLHASTVSAAIAADNIVVALYFAFLFSISKAGEGETEDASAVDPKRASSQPGSNLSPAPESVIAEAAIENESSSSITLSALATSIAVASTLVSVGGLCTKRFLSPGMSALPMISFLTVMAATLFPLFFSRISETGTALGVVFIQMFFAASGAAGSIRLVIQQAPSLFAFSALQIAVHFGTLMAVGRGILGLPKRELYLASNANVGGPTTAAAMAQAKEWKRLVLPALLVGILGYASATALALALGPILQRLPLQGGVL